MILDDLKKFNKNTTVNVLITFSLNPPKCYQPNYNKTKNNTHNAKPKGLLLPSWGLICYISYYELNQKYLKHLTSLFPCLLFHWENHAYVCCLLYMVFMKLRDETRSCLEFSQRTKGTHSFISTLHFFFWLKHWSCNKSPKGKLWPNWKASHQCICWPACIMICWKPGKTPTTLEIRGEGKEFQGFFSFSFFFFKWNMWPFRCNGSKKGWLREVGEGVIGHLLGNLHLCDHLGTGG